MKDIIKVFLLSLVASIGLFSRTWLFGFDSYAFVSASRGLVSLADRYPAFIYLVEHIPQSFLIYNLIMWACLFVSLLALFYTAKKLSDKPFLITAIVLAAAPILIFDFAQFQNELLAYPFIFWSFTALMYKRPWISLLLGLCSCVFWMGGFVWIAIIATGFVFSFILALLLGFPFWYDKIGYAVGNIQGVSFNTYFFGLIDYFMLFPVILFIFRGKDKRFMIWILVSVGLACLSARYVILSIPFLLYGVKEMLPFIEKYVFSGKFLLGACIFMILCWNIALYLQEPQPFQMEGVQKFISICRDENVVCYNDWSIGWWVLAEGGTPSNRAGPPGPDYNSLSRPFVALTQEKLECTLISGGSRINIYRCN